MEKPPTYEADVDALAHKCFPIFAGQPPENVGAALAILLATWAAGHHPESRGDVLDVTVATARELIPVIAEERGGRKWI